MVNMLRFIKNGLKLNNVISENSCWIYGIQLTKQTHIWCLVLYFYYYKTFFTLIPDSELSLLFKTNGFCEAITKKKAFLKT